MNSAACPQLQPIWDRRRGAIAEHWNSAIAQTGFVPLDAIEVRRRMAELTDQVIAVLAAEPFEQDKAWAIGRSLASLHYVRPDALALTVQVLADQLVQELPAEQVVALQPRLSAVLGALSAGFLQQSTSILLSEQERIRGALVTSLQEAQQALRAAYDQVESKVKERTAELAAANQRLEQEIEERRRIEAALRESEARYRAISELSSDFAYAFRVEPDGTLELEWITDAVVRISGYTMEEIMASGSWMRILHPDDRDTLAQSQQKIFSGQADTREVRFITQDGQTRWLHITGRPVWDPVQARVARIYGAAQDITERKQMETALRESEARYRAISELTSDFAYAYRVNPDGTLENEWITDAIARISGYTMADIVACDSWLTIIHPDDIALAKRRQQIALSGQTVGGEIRVTTQDGQTRWLYTTSRPVWDPVQGRVVRMYGAARDITERKQAEEALRESEERFRALIENSSDAISLLDARGKILFESPSVKRVLGYDSEELVGRNILELVHPDDLASVQSAFAQISPTPGSSVTLSTRYRHKDDSWRWIEGIGTNLLAEPDLQAIVVNYRDITERKQFDRDLLQIYRMSQTLAATLDSRQVLGQLVQAVTDITRAEGSSIWLWAQENADELVCHAAFPLRREDTLVGLRRVAGQGVVGWVVQNGKSAIVADTLDDARFLPDIDAKTGYHTQSLLATPLRAHDAVIGVLEVVNKRDGEFDTHDQTLVETLSGSAAIAIKNAQLVESLRQIAATLKARNEELDTFSHTVAHDLKGPLINVLGSAEVLAEEPSTLTQEERRRFTQSVVRNGRKMDNIIDELLLLAGLRNIPVVAEPLDMSSIVAEARLRLTDMFAACQAEVVMPATWPVAMGHAPWVEEVWVNYISNALKYGGQPPRVELGGELQPDGTVRLWVRDNGPGMTAEDCARLFAPFTRLNPARARGHGLGLSIVRRIVEKLGGQVGVTSALGQGSTFFFSLPARRANPPQSSG